LEDEKDRGLPTLIPKRTRDGNQTAYWNSFNFGINCVRARHWIGQGIEGYLIQHDPPQPPPPEPQQDRRRDHAGGDGAKSGNEEKTRYIEQVAEPGKAIVGTNTNPFWKWKSPWYEQVSIQAAQSIHLATVLGIVGHNVTGESEHSYEYLGRFMGRTWRTALNQMKPLIKCGNVEVLNQGGKKGDRKTANLIRPVLKTGQPKALDVLLGKSAKAPKPESTK